MKLFSVLPVGNELINNCLDPDKLSDHLALNPVNAHHECERSKQLRDQVLKGHIVTTNQTKEEGYQTVQGRGLAEGSIEF